MSVSNLFVPNNFNVYAKNCASNVLYTRSPTITTTANVVTGANMIPGAAILTTNGIAFPAAADIWAAQPNPRAGDTFFITIFNGAANGNNITFGAGSGPDPTLSAFSETSIGATTRRIYRIVLNSASSVFINSVSSS